MSISKDPSADMGKNLTLNLKILENPSVHILDPTPQEAARSGHKKNASIVSAKQFVLFGGDKAQDRQQSIEKFDG